MSKKDMQTGEKSLEFNITSAIIYLNLQAYGVTYIGFLGLERHSSILSLERYQELI